MYWSWLEYMFDRELILIKLHEYIDMTDDPQIKEFCLDRSNPCDDTLVEWGKEIDSGFSAAIKRLIAKQEVYLSRQTSVMAIFRLKQPQHGYKDKTEQDINATFTQIIHPVLLD